MNDKLFYLLLVALVALGFWLIDRRRERAWHEFTEREHCERKAFRHKLLDTISHGGERIGK